MLVLQKLFLFSLLVLPFPQAQTNPKQELNDQMYEAVRKGDAAAVTAALDRGADVNAKFRYGTTALFKAAERGNAEVAKVLLDHGADVQVKDTFYGATALSWALQNDHIDIVRMLLAKGADGADEVLTTGVENSKEEVVKLALESKALKPDALTAALALSSLNEKNAAITELLKKAGAQPPLQVDAAVLQTYAGQYKSDTGPQATVTVKNGTLSVAGLTREPQPLMAIDNTTFRPIAFAGLSLVFTVDAGKVVSMTLKQGPNNTVFKRSGE